MQIHFLVGGSSSEHLAEIFLKLEKQQGVQAVLMLSAEQNTFSVEQLNLVLKAAKLPVFGGIFPQIIYAKNNYTEGTLLIGLEAEPVINVVKNLSCTEGDFENSFIDCPQDTEHKTAFIAVDAFSTRISDFIESFFNFYGLEFNILGGGAGSLSLEQKPCLYTNEGVLQDAAVLAIFNVQSGVGVRHGWKDLSGPYRASKSEKNCLFTLDNEPAFSLYKRVVEQDSKQTITRENFFDIAKAYPFGISRLGAEKIVRDPYLVNPDNSMNFFGEIPQGVYLHILKGETDALVQAAGEAFAEAAKTMENVKQAKTIVFIDCISRVLFLQDHFKEELNAIAQNPYPLIGALTLGEIANNQKEFLEFYNKTAVVSIIEGL